MRPRGGADDGTATAIVLVQLTVAAVACAAVGDVAAVLGARQRAGTAADAAALGAVTEQWRLSATTGDPARVARELARSNGASLVECSCEPRGDARVTVEVAVRVRVLRAAPRTVRATAVARLDPGELFRPIRPP